MYNHLRTNEVIPELHLTRWLRCLLSREYEIQSCLLVWDFIFSGAVSSDDPMQNLDLLCTAMILSLRYDLMESDDSTMCLGLLMSFKEPKDVKSEILEKAVKVRECLVNG